MTAHGPITTTHGLTNPLGAHRSSFGQINCPRYVIMFSIFSQFQSNYDSQAISRILCSNKDFSQAINES